MFTMLSPKKLLILLIWCCFATIYANRCCTTGIADDAIVMEDNHEINQHEILDIFAIVYTSLFSASDLPFVANGNFWLLFRYASLMQRKGSLRFHIVTDSHIVAQQGNELGFNMYMVSSYSELNSTFWGIYSPNHYSAVSGPGTKEYEFLCFFRWIIYANIVENWNAKKNTQPIKNILAMDSDVLLLISPTKFYYRVLNSLHYSSSSDYEMIVIAPGALHLFSAHGLQQYALFIYAWYNRTASVVESSVKSVAGKLWGHYHFSDMQIAEVFMMNNYSSRPPCFMYGPTIKIAAPYKSSIDRCLLSKLGCIPVRKYDEDILQVKDKQGVVGHHLRIEGRHIYGGVNESLPLCFLHFQGDVSKKVSIVFARYLLEQLPGAAILVNGGKHGGIGNYNASNGGLIGATSIQNATYHGHSIAPRWLQLLQTANYLIKGLRDDRVYLVRNGVRHWISNFDIFQDMQLSEKEIIYEVPNSLMKRIMHGADIFV